MFTEEKTSWEQEMLIREAMESAEHGFTVHLKNGARITIREGANKQVISSQADSLIKISRIWADFFPANTSNQPI